MINNFEKQLEKWNNGVLRGAQAKLAKCLQVSTATVALWATGKRHPSKGYLNQLARLFNMDAYDVARLFLPTAPAASFSFLPHKITGLRDSAAADNTYSTDNFQYNLRARNSVMLPLFMRLPDEFPNYQESQVAEWWTLPRRATQGTQFLMPAALTDVPSVYAEDILFIYPVAKWMHGHLMLVRYEKKYLVRRILKQGEQLKWKELGKKEIRIPALAKPIGIIMERLTNVLF